METSAKDSINIKRAFHELAEAILDKYRERFPHDVPDRVAIDLKQEKTSRCCC